jgi:hypothetical protein
MLALAAYPGRPVPKAHLVVEFLRPNQQANVGTADDADIGASGSVADLVAVPVRFVSLLWPGALEVVGCAGHWQPHPAVQHSLCSRGATSSFF